MAQELCLYGGKSGWSKSGWVTTDDRVRGGSSKSHLSIQEHGSVAVFHGHLDTSTLGGAGFASQHTAGILHYDLSSYDGIRITLPAQKGDDKLYVITLKDELPGKRDDGREKSGLSWEAGFAHVDCESVRDIVLPWASFMPTYRGRAKPDAKPLRRSDIQRIGFMMRSFFDTQDGDFSMKIASISAYKAEETEGEGFESSDEKEMVYEKPPMGFSGVTPPQPSSRRRGWMTRFCCPL